MKIGILSPSEIAYRRFMPALKKMSDIEFLGIAIAEQCEWYKGEELDDFLEIKKSEREKAQKFIDEYGGKIYNSYSDMIHDKEIDAIYIPLPPALHFKWANEGLKNNKHVLVEKPATINHKDTQYLIDMAKKNNLVFYENYMFMYHSQIDFIVNLLKENKIGRIWKMNVSFGFPRRSSNDFRYNKDLGGGALIDCGGYTIKLVNSIVDNLELKYAKLFLDSINPEIDIYGNAIYETDDMVAEVEFGMDNDYRCTLDIWGSKGSIKTDRILTAPVGFSPTVELRVDNTKELLQLPEDDTFFKSIQRFAKCVINNDERNKMYEEIFVQSERIEKFMCMVNK